MTDPAKPSLFRSRAFTTGLMQSVLLLLVGLAVMRVVPKFEPAFSPTSVPLPAATVTLINVRHFLGHYWYLIFLPLCLWPFLNGSIALMLSPSSTFVVPARIWIWATWVLLLLLVLYVATALMLPLVTLIQKV